MNLPEGWKLVPVEPTVEIAQALDLPRFPFSLEYNPERWKAALATAPTPPAQERIELPYFDAGSLPDFIDGDAELWQDAIRNLLEVAHEHYQEQVDDLLSATPPAQEDENDSYLTNCHIISRQEEDKPLFVGSGDKVFCRLDRYTVMPTEQYDKLRKAAEKTEISLEALFHIVDNVEVDSEVLALNIAAILDNLRAALESK